MITCDHSQNAQRFEWVNGRHEPLHCRDCGAPWPGRPLPIPAHSVDGLGELARQPGWNARVRKMASDLAEIEV